MKIHSMSCYSNQEANGTWDVRSTLNMIVDSVQDVGAFQRAWQAFVESVAAPAVQDAVIAEAPTRPEPRVEPVVEAAPVQADDVVVYATPAAPVLFGFRIPDPIIHIENNTTPAAEPEPVVGAEPAPVVEEAPKQKRTRKKAEPAPEPVPAPVVAQEAEPEQEDLFSAPPPKAAKVAVGTVKVGDQTFACTYNETGVYMTCKVVLTDELAAKLGVPAKQFTATSDTKKDAASIVAEEIQDYLEVQSWKSKPPAPAPAPEPEPAPVVVPAPAPEPELTAADNPHVPPEVLRIMMDSRKLADTAVRSEVLALWCKHLYHVIGIKTSEEILAHMNKHQSRLVIFEKKPLGSSVPKLVITLVEGYEKPVQPKRTTFKAEAPEAVTEVPGDEIDEDDIPL